MSRQRDLALTVVTTIVLALITLLVPVDVVRLIAAIPLCFFLPGYAFSAACFATYPLPGRLILVMSLGLSLAILAIGALIINFFPGGIRPGPWALLLVVVTVAASAVAIQRRPGPVKFAPSLPPIGAANAVLLGTATLIVAASIVLSQTVLPAHDVLSYTQLSMLPADGGAGVQIGVLNQEQGSRSYRLVVRFEGGRQVSRSLRLHSGDERVIDQSAPGGGGGNVTALLFRASQPGHVYRRVTATLPAGGEG